MAKFRGKKSHQHPPPEGRVRRSQAITTYGPGAMVDLVDHAVIVGGLDHWSYSAEPDLAKEPRLRDVVAKVMFKIDPAARLSLDKPFRLPPAGDDHQLTRQNGIRVFEFPRWFVCQNPDCRALVGGYNLKWTPQKKRYEHGCAKGTGIATPVRFVMACSSGHLEDVDWSWFTHRENRCAAPSLTLKEGATRDFSEIKVTCACGQGRMLADAFVSSENGPQCHGEQPWLGPNQREDCDKQLRLLVRTASNAYFAQVVSALSIPDAAHVVRDAVSSVWDKLQIVKDAGMLALVRQYPDVAKALGTLPDAEVLASIEDIRAGRELDRGPLRTAEFTRFLSEPVEREGDLPPVDRDFFARSFAPKDGLPKQFDRLVRAHRLREVRVQIGFTRLEAPTPNLQGEYDLGVKTAPLVRGGEWLPAAEIHGEGLFLKLSDDAVEAWEERPAVRAREAALRAGHEAWVKATAVDAKFPGVRYYLLHSLSHLLMSALSIECGYGVSALGERIYCSTPEEDVSMAAILIKTGTPGAEGTLGGLVEQARELRTHLRRAYDMAVLCSHDPVCASHDPQGDLGERHLEGAACHGCLYLAESSCERFNRYLDRALVVPVMGRDAALAFLQERP